MNIRSLVLSGFLVLGFAAAHAAPAAAYKKDIKAFNSWVAKLNGDAELNSKKTNYISDKSQGSVKPQTPKFNNINGPVLDVLTDVEYVCSACSDDTLDATKFCGNYDWIAGDWVGTPEEEYCFASSLVNVSTRGKVGLDSAQEALIGGFAVRGGSRLVVIDAKGPSLRPFGIPAAVSDPYIEIYDQNGVKIYENDDWVNQDNDRLYQNLLNSGYAPTSNLESAVIVTLPEGNYTVVVRGYQGAVGVGIVEVYDLDAPSANKPARKKLNLK